MCVRYSYRGIRTMTNKFLNILLIVLTAFIIVYFPIRVVYWGLEINKADSELPPISSAAIEYVIK